MSDVSDGCFFRLSHKEIEVDSTGDLLLGTRGGTFEIFGYSRGIFTFKIWDLLRLTVSPEALEN